MAGTQGSSYSSADKAAAANKAVTKNVKSGLNPSGSSKTAANYGTGGNTSANAAAAAAARAAAASAMARGSDSSGSGNAASRANAAGSMTLGRIAGAGGGNSGRTATSSPMGAAMTGFGGQGIGGAISGIQSGIGGGASALRSPFDGPGVAGNPNARNVIGQVNPNDLRMPQAQSPVEQRSANLAAVASPGFSQAQFGNQRYAPGQMYANPATQDAALRSVVNGIQLRGGTPQQQLNSLYSNMGYNPAGRAGVIGALEHESANFAPDVLAGKRMGDAGTAFGLGQWRDYVNPKTGATDPRMTNAKNYVSGMGLPANSLLGQGAFAGTELANSYPKAFDAVQSAQDPRQAAEAMIGYEKPAGYGAYLKTGDPRKVAGWSDRLSNAQQAFNLSPATGSGSAPTTMVASAEQSSPGMLTSRVVNGKLENYYEPAPGATITPAAAPPVQTAGGWFDGLKSKLPQSVQDGLQTASTAYNDYADKYATMPGSDAQKAAAIKGYAENGLLGGAWGYLTGGGIGPGKQVSSMTSPGGRSQDEQFAAEMRQVEQQAQNSPEYLSMTREQQSEVMQLVRRGMSLGQAIVQVRGKSPLTGGTGTGTGNGGSSLKYPNYYSQWAGLPSGQTYG